MAPRRKKLPAPTGLRGGVGEDISTPGGVFSQTLDRLEVNRPTTSEFVRRQMLGKNAASRQSVAEALLAAAYQHRNTPDAGSALYGRAFLSLPNADRQSLLALLDPADAPIVQEAFGDFVDAVSEPAGPTGRLEAAQARAQDAAPTALTTQQAPICPQMTGVSGCQGA